MPVSTCSAVIYYVISHLIQKLKADVANLSSLRGAASLLFCKDPSAHLIEAPWHMCMLTRVGRQTQYQIE